jgi:dynein heavy chain 1
LTLDVLKTAKRFHATVSFIADTGLKEATDLVQKYNILLKDFPMTDLLSAPDLVKLRDAIIMVFAHVNKKIKISMYASCSIYRVFLISGILFQELCN